MKKFFKVNILFILLFFPICVFALDCGGKTVNNAITSDDFNFLCTGIKGSSLKFYYNNKEYTNFVWDKDTNKVKITDSSFKFSDNTSVEYISIKAVDGENNEAYINVKNSAYVKPATTTTTTITTVDTNIKKVVVTMDYNDGTNTIKTEECSIKNGNSYCNVTLPNLDDSNFNGWGTSKSCTTGNKGSFKIEKDITYYACYKNNSESINLKKFIVMDKDTNKAIDFGIFSSSVDTYSFKVLYEVNNIDVTVDDGYSVTLDGNTNLVVGDNKVVVKVVDGNNNSKEYTLNIKKLKSGETLSDIIYLKSLSVSGYPIDFKKDVFEYTITIPSDIDNLDITAISEDTSIKPQILNNTNILDGTIVKIILKSGDKSTIYKINIIKEKENNILLYAIGAVVLLIIVLLILIIVKVAKKKKNNDNNKSNKDEIEVLNI